MQEWPQSGEVLTFFIVDKKEPALSKSEAGRRQLIFSPFRTAEVMPLVVTSFQENTEGILPAARDSSIGLTFVRYIYNIFMK